VATRRRLGLLLEGVEPLVARVVEVVLVQRVAGLEGAQAGLEGHAVALEPAQGVRAALAELAQQLVADHALRLHREVLHHLVDRVLDTGLSLDVRPPSGVEHPAADGRGTAAVEAVHHQHVEPALAPLEGRADARATEADDDEVRGVVPALGRGVIEDQRRLRRIGGVGARACGGRA
jgi:hypothetical protein